MGQLHIFDGVCGRQSARFQCNPRHAPSWPEVKSHALSDPCKTKATAPPFVLSVFGFRRPPFFLVPPTVPLFISWP